MASVPITLTPSRFAAFFPGIVVDEKTVGVEFEGKGDCFDFAGVESLDGIDLERGLNFDPRGERLKPCADGFRRLRMREFRRHGRRNQHLAEQRRENVNRANQDQISNWRCIGDDDHRGFGGLARAARSSSNSSGVIKSSVT